MKAVQILSSNARPSIDSVSSRTTADIDGLSYDYLEKPDGIHDQGSISAEDEQGETSSVCT